MSRSLQLLILVIAGAGALFAGIYLSRHADFRSGASHEAPTAKAVPARLSPLTLPDVMGQSVSSSQWQGQTVLVNFWATWCAPCREEIPVFSQVGRKYADRGLKVVGIALDDLDMARRFGDEIGLDYQSLVAGRDEGYALMEHYNSAGALPFSMLVSPSGEIVAHKLGIWHLEPLTEAIEAALPKP